MATERPGLTAPLDDDSVVPGIMLGTRSPANNGPIRYRSGGSYPPVDHGLPDPVEIVEPVFVTVLAWTVPVGVFATFLYVATHAQEMQDYLLRHSP